MAAAVYSRPRVSVDGKFFRLGGKKFYVKGVTYGPLAPNAAGQPFASPEQTAADFAQIRELGANVVRVYHPPPTWFLDLASQHELFLLVDIPWNKHLCFLDSIEQRRQACEAVRRAVYACGRHPAVFAFSVVNEIPPDVVRWSGTRAVADFIDELILEAKRIDSEALCTFTSFPSTEFLRPQNVDFVCFNVYLHDRQPFQNYIARLQMWADSKPLLLGEFGIDSLREGEARKCGILEWQIEETFRAGLAGTIVFSLTDDWWHGAERVEDWEMGLTARNREPKASFGVVKKAFESAPYFPLPQCPKVSVVVAAYNAERTLKICLDSLQRLNYANYEVIVVDDGSTDTTAQIAREYPTFRYFRHQTNLGLSLARDTGISAAEGDIIAFTDADCRADEDWLYYMVGALCENEFAGMGGPNLLPPDDSLVAAAVMVSPGGPAHVMLTDRQAEHIPGCNMAFWRDALLEIGGFDPVFRRAGDDVDLCWRLQQAGYKIGFCPSAFVWHYRRSTVQAYLKQQHGYGEAEAMLVRKHPEYFNYLGGSLWRGRIYTASKFGVLVRPPIIYRGLFASAGYQFLYNSDPAISLMLFTTLEYHVLVTVPLWVLAVMFPALLPLAMASVLTSAGVCVAAGAQASLPRRKIRWWSRPLVALLFFLQPIVRGWARYQGRLSVRPTPLVAQQTIDSLALRHSRIQLREVSYWADPAIDRLSFVTAMLRKLESQAWPHKADSGWSDYDIEVYGSRWSNLQLTTVIEAHPVRRQLVRCRLRPKWSLHAKALFWALCGFELLVLGFLGAWFRWLWFLLLTLPALAWLLQREQRSLQSMMVVLLDELARDWKLAKVMPTPEAPAPPTQPPNSAASPFSRKPTPDRQRESVSIP
jgi:GT2 family glycosyltransferase